MEYNEFERCGGEESISTDVRVIALSSKKISQLVTEGSFREDLYYRLNEIAINIPHYGKEEKIFRILLISILMIVIINLIKI